MGVTSVYLLVGGHCKKTVHLDKVSQNIKK